MMKWLWIAAGAAVATAAGCASPLDDSRYADGAGATTRDVAAWLRDDDGGLRDTTAGSGPGASGQGDAAQDDRIDASSTLDDLIAFALAEHPQVMAAEAGWEAARQRIVPARTLDDPELSYRLAIEQIETAQSPVSHVIGVSQRLPWFGTLDAAGDVAASEARAAGQRYLAAQVEVVAAVRDAWAEYAYLHEAQAVTREHGELLEQLESVVESLVRTDQAGQRDLIRVQSERDRVKNDRQELADVRRAAASRLNAAIGRGRGEPLPEPGELPDEPVDIDEDLLVAALAEINPDLQELDHTMRARRHAMRRAEKAFYPDFMVGVEYGVNTGRRMARMGGGGEDMLAARVGVSLPIWRDRYEAERREALAQWGEASQRQRDRRHTLEADLAMAAAGLRDAQRRIDLYGRTLTVRAEQVLESTQTAYQTGEASFTDLIEAQRELLAFMLAWRRAQADRFQRLAEIEAIVGRTIDQNDLTDGERP